MYAEKNLELIKARYDAVNAHDWERFQSFYDDSIVWHDSGLSAPIRGPVQVRKRLEELATAFPDLHWKLERLFGQNEYVCAEFTFEGTHVDQSQTTTGANRFQRATKPFESGQVVVHASQRQDN